MFQLKSAIKAVFLFAVTVMITSVVGTLFFCAGWNAGVVHAINGTNPISLGTAFWFSLFAATVTAYLKFSVKVVE